ncbi:uncharacterized protein [Rutidosis leptorrhynchoides]|uniref:uncharacterized protein n=1 Tax=Rutidosis leptorrhynchoides TaxID=125765 RepID=UPI003A9A4527
MEKWRRKGERFNQEFTKSKANYNYKKPPIGGSSNRQPNIPYWEKRFVSVVGSFSWNKFMEAKKFTHLYNDVMNWDDSAGEAAFTAAKDRFRKQFYGLPCDIDLHNPDLYVDEIDWNVQADQSLILDLESEPVVNDGDCQHDPVVIFGDVLPDPYNNFSPFGWGDSDDDKIKNLWGVNDDMKGDQNGINWDDYIQNGRIIWDDDCNVGDGNKLCVSNVNDDNKAGDLGWDTYDNYWGFSNVNDNKVGDQGWGSSVNNRCISNEYDNKAVDQGWDENGNDWCVSNENGNKAVDQGWDENGYDWCVSNVYDNKAVDQGWGESGNDWCVSNEIYNKAVDQGWDSSNNYWGVSNENDNKTGDYGWNANKYNDNSYYYSCYGNVNNERCVSNHKTWRFQENNGQRDRSWRNNGNRKSNSQGQGNQRGHGSTFRAYGNQRIYVRP